MIFNPFEPPQKEVSKSEIGQLLSRLVSMPASALASIVRLFSYAKKQKISFDQALDEAVMALPLQYTPVDLSAWLALCEAASVPAVPATKGPVLSVELLEKLESYTPDNQPADVLAAAKWIAAEHAKGRIWRWECCAPELLKMFAGLRRTSQPLVPAVPFSVDQRLFHILWSEQRTDIGLLSRPWVEPMLDKGVPVEFRVFFSPDGCAACSYYPQRKMNERFLPDMEMAVMLTEKLAVAMAANNFTPPSKLGFSCDWMLLKTGAVVFLEAGPPCTSSGGAHPCCFSLPQYNPEGGIQPGRRLLESEKGAQFYCAPGIQDVVDDYLAEKIDFDSAAKTLKMAPERLAGLFAIQGIIPREIHYRRVTALETHL